MKKPELLAPAGDFACLKAAINAGADAVYLGGEEYGARAYASNFSKEELCEAVSYAHLFDVKLYLTVNTLVKERELEHLTEFLLPVCDAGLDGVIVQDFGVLKKIKDTFPNLELHASTQMCIANVYGAELLKTCGVSRIVPARELSLEEIRNIKENTHMELECFIHGAMCYCYSGQCLFSSFLGGRSGNRGRCAGPCRLPYEAFGNKNKYPLSLKDLCTISMLGELINAGIDSFKIEGRMKNPIYVAGVTSIYRKYIDKLLQKPSQKSAVLVSKEDMDILQNLYIRTGLQDGYYHRHNGNEMLTMEKPGYSSAKEDMFSKIKEAYISKDKKIPITGELIVKTGSPLCLKISDAKGHEEVFVGEEPAVCAQKRPISVEDIKKQMNKTGNTAFYFTSFSVIMNDSVFVSLKELGKIRRRALDIFYHKLLADKVNKSTRTEACGIQKPENEPDRPAVSFETLSATKQKGYRIFCSTMDQLIHMAEYIRCYTGDALIDGIGIHAFLLKNPVEKLEQIIAPLKEKGLGIYLVLPPVFRKNASDYLNKHETLVFSDMFDGYYCNGPDAFAYVKSMLQTADKPIIADYAFYMCNHEAVSFIQELGAGGLTVPYELTHYEWLDLKRELQKNGQEPYQEYVVYGHIPFMQSANCIKKSFDRCNHKTETVTIKDRIGKNVYITTQCEICENTVYNGIPLSLHKETEHIKADMLRICFTIETGEEACRVLDLYLKRMSVPFSEYTLGHFKKGIE